MARVLIVGCGCRGRELAGELRQRGHAVRGTSRTADGVAAIEAAGIEGVVAEPAVLGTLLPHLGGISVLCWLMGTADPPPRPELFETLLETLVDTHVRGVVYEPAGDAGEAARRASETYRMPVEAVTEPPEDFGRWLPAAVRAVDAVLAA